MRNPVIPCLALLLAGCATDPAAVQPRATDARMFEGYTCEELAQRKTATDAELQRYVESQERARIGDAFTWPVSTARIFGKNTRNVNMIAQLRGELQAIDQVQHVKRCDIPNR